MSYGDSCSHPSGYEQGNTGYSGTPMWKIKQQMEAHLARQQIPSVQQGPIGGETLSSKSARLLLDGVVLPRKQASKQPVVPSAATTSAPAALPSASSSARQVLVRDLRKVGQVLRIPLPRQGIFEDGSGLVPCSLFAVFDGNQCTPSSASGWKAAEFSCRNLPAKLLGNLSIIPAERCNQVFMKSALLKTFEDLEADPSRPAGAAERCAAAVALVLGDFVCTAVLGRCTARLCRHDGGELVSAGYSVTELGGRRRGPAGGSMDAGMPEVAGHEVSAGPRRRLPCLVLGTAAAADALAADDLAAVVASFPARPRAASGEVAAVALGSLRAEHTEGVAGESAMNPDSCAAVVAFFAEPGGAGASDAGAAKGEPAAKKPRIEGQALQSVRLRQILVRHKDSKHPMDPVKNRPITRSRSEAEEILREALKELMKDGDHTGDSMWAAKSTTTISKVIRGTSECKSALKGGSMCGDVGWLGKKELQALGKDLEEAVRSLAVGEWSDLLPSAQGVHVMMRIA